MITVLVLSILLIVLHYVITKNVSNEVILYDDNFWIATKITDFLAITWHYCKISASVASTSPYPRLGLFGVSALCRTKVD